MLLKTICNKYQYHLQEMQRNTDPCKVERLEEKRIRLYNQLLDVLDALNIPYADRDDAAMIAWQYLRK